MGRNESFTAQVGEIRAHKSGVGMRRIAISDSPPALISKNWKKKI